MISLTSIDSHRQDDDKHLYVICRISSKRYDYLTRVWQEKTCGISGLVSKELADRFLEHLENNQLFYRQGISGLICKELADRLLSKWKIGYFADVLRDDGR